RRVPTQRILESACGLRQVLDTQFGLGRHVAAIRIGASERVPRGTDDLEQPVRATAGFVAAAGIEGIVFDTRHGERGTRVQALRLGLAANGVLRTYRARRRQRLSAAQQ